MRPSHFSGLILILLVSLSGSVVGLDNPLQTETSLTGSTLEGDLSGETASTSTDTTSEKKYLILHLTRTPDEEIISTLESLGVDIRYEYSLIDAVAVKLDSSLESVVADQGFVERIEEDARTEPVIAQSAVQIEANTVWLEHDVTGKNTVIAVLDTGIDNQHPDLQNVVDEHDFTGEGTDDYNGHGTHVASIAAGTGDGSAGTYRGMAHGASLMDVKVLDRHGSGRMSDTIAGIEYAVTRDADIISMSIGARVACNGMDATSMAADAAVERGAIVVAAAGNDGPVPRSITSPGCSKKAITVGAVDPADNIAPFSSRGPTLDGRMKPEVVAPGVLITAADTGGGYTQKSGTSMATPHVSGVAALMLEQNPELTHEQIKTTLQDTAEDIGEDSSAQGDGRVNAYDAFIAATGLTAADREEEDTNNQQEKESSSSSEDEKQAKQSARESGEVDEVRSVEKRERNGTPHYRVTGLKNGTMRDVWVTYNGDVVATEQTGLLRRTWIFLQTLVSTFLPL